MSAARRRRPALASTRGRTTPAGARGTPSRPRGDPNPAGAHALADRIAAALVAAAGIGPDDLVLDIGAGMGAVTRPLARTGARVIAVERDAWIAQRLSRRMEPWPNVTVLTGDALLVPLPGRPYRVVANLPFAITTALLRRLVDTRIVAADLVVEIGAGRRLSGMPDRPELVRWHRRFTITLGRRIPATSFRPAPPVDGVVLQLRRRSARSGRANVSVPPAGARTRGYRVSGSRTRRSGRAGR